MLRITPRLLPVYAPPAAGRDSTTHEKLEPSLSFRQLATEQQLHICAAEGLGALEDGLSHFLGIYSKDLLYEDLFRANGTDPMARAVRCLYYTKKYGSIDTRELEKALQAIDSLLQNTNPEAFRKLGWSRYRKGILMLAQDALIRLRVAHNNYSTLP